MCLCPSTSLDCDHRANRSNVHRSPQKNPISPMPPASPLRLPFSLYSPLSLNSSHPLHRYWRRRLHPRSYPAYVLQSRRGRKKAQHPYPGSRTGPLRVHGRCKHSSTSLQDPYSNQIAEAVGTEVRRTQWLDFSTVSRLYAWHMAPSPRQSHATKKLTLTPARRRVPQGRPPRPPHPHCRRSRRHAHDPRLHHSRTGTRYRTAARCRFG